MLQLVSHLLLDLTLFLVTAVATHLVMSFGQTLMHYKLGHNPMGGRFFRNHINYHHTYYSKDHLVSRTYLGDQGNNTPFFFIPVILAGACTYLVLPVDLFVVQLIACAASFYAHVFFDKEYHVEGSRLQRFAWFRRKQELHFVHHRHAGSNFAVIHFFWGALRARQSGATPPRTMAPRIERIPSSSLERARHLVLYPRKRDATASRRPSRCVRHHEMVDPAAEAFVPGEPLSSWARLIAQGRLGHRRIRMFRKTTLGIAAALIVLAPSVAFAGRAAAMAATAIRPRPSRPPPRPRVPSSCRLQLVCRRWMLSVSLGRDPLRARQASRERLRLLLNKRPRSPSRDRGYSHRRHSLNHRALASSPDGVARVNFGPT